MKRFRKNHPFPFDAGLMMFCFLLWIISIDLDLIIRIIFHREYLFANKIVRLISPFLIFAGVYLYVRIINDGIRERIIAEFTNKGLSQSWTGIIIAYATLITLFALMIFII